MKNISKGTTQYTKNWTLKAFHFIQQKERTQGDRGGAKLLPAPPPSPKIEI
jgi:hypothetical protein